LGNLLANHRNYTECADYRDSPTSQAVIMFVEKMIKKYKNKS
jgi:hypothetical protein